MRRSIGRWANDGQVKGFFRLLDEYDVTPAQVGDALNGLREAYAKHQDAEHYTAIIGQRKVVVTMSEFLQSEVHKTINGMMP